MQAARAGVHARVVYGEVHEWWNLSLSFAAPKWDQAIQ